MHKLANLFGTLEDDGYYRFYLTDPSGKSQEKILLSCMPGRVVEQPALFKEFKRISQEMGAIALADVCGVRKDHIHGITMQDPTVPNGTPS